MKMATEFEIKAEVRTDAGKGASRRLRHANKVPAVLYGAGKDSVSLTLQHDEISHALENEAFYSHILKLNIGKGSEKAVLKDLQRHPSKPRVMHVDFQRVSAKEKLHMNVPLHFLGEDVAPGVKLGGGIVSHQLAEVEITCLPKDLPEYLEVDLSAVELNEIVHLSDINLPEGVEMVALAHDHDLTVASIHMPRAVKEEEEEVEAAPEGEEAAAAEGEEQPAEGGESES